MSIPHRRRRLRHRGSTEIGGDAAAGSRSQRRVYKVAVAGNPNCGKTSIFNALAGAHQHVGNYAGVTVETRSARVKWGGEEIELIDLPGAYSLSAVSLDERVARDFILREKPDVVINVLDAGNLERNLYLTVQLLEMGVDVVLDLNMWDEVLRGGTNINTDRLSQLLGAPVVRTIGHRRIGLGRLVLATLELLEDRHEGHRHPPVTYGHAVDDRIAELVEIIAESSCNQLPSRWYAAGLLEQSIASSDLPCLTPEQKNTVDEKIREASEHIKRTTGSDTATVISDGRYGFISGILHSVIQRGEGDRMAISRKIDNILTNRIVGFPIFLVFVWLLFQATFQLGQYPAHWIDLGVGWLAGIIASFLPPGPVENLITEGIIGGVGSVLVFLPNIMILFLGISILEDSGYMSRAAFIMDRLMRTIGLQGKAFIPMLIGFGCNVPAVMATRTLESRRERILTVLLIPFMSCSARLPVFVLFASAFFVSSAGNIVFLMYLIGVAIAILLGRILKTILFREKQVPFVMELPPYRVPTAGSALIHMWERGRVYLKKMGGVILIASVILWFLGAYPKLEPAGQAGGQVSTEVISQAERVEHSYIGRLGSVVAPAIEPLGFNWQMGVSLLTGFIAKEVVVSSMGVLYHIGEGVDEESSGLIEALRDPANGITPLAAFAFMVFVLLYTPCITVLVAIYREIGMRWAIASVFLQLGVAWISAWLIYNVGLFIGIA
jgi:ferrous iron transport protein B